MRFACERGPIGDVARQQAARTTASAPSLTTERLCLRPIRASDFEVWATIACTERGAHIGGPMTREDAWFDFIQLAASWMLHGFGGWTITWKDAEAPLGFVVLGFEPGDREPEIGWLLAEAAEGQGIALEAARPVRAHAETLRLPSLVSYIANANTRSAALAAQLGARPDMAATHGMDAKADFTVWRHLPTAAEARP